MTEDTQTLRKLQQESIRLRDQNSTLREYVGRLQQTLRALNDLQRSLDRITVDTDVFKLIHSILKAAISSVNSANGALLLLDEESGELVYVDVIGETRSELLHYRLPKDVGVASWSAARRAPKLVPDVSQEPTFSPLVDHLSQMRVGSLLCVPLWDENRTLGVIEAVSTAGGKPLDDADEDIMLLAARLASMAIIKAEQVQA